MSVAPPPPGGAAVATAPAATLPPAPSDDPRLGPVFLTMPPERPARRRAAITALVCALLAVWYLAWLLQEKRIGSPPLFGLLIGAEAFNLLQAVGFWWTCSHQRLRPGRAPRSADFPVDVLIPTYDEPLEIAEPTVAAAMRLRGADVRVWLLDDGGRGDMREMAERHGAGYIAREGRSGAKAGNLNHALGVTSAPFVVVLDCDHVPHADLLERTLGHVEDPEVAFVQTPQYYANAAASPVAAAAAAQQELFFGPIARGKDGLGAIFCCGTNVVFRREALADAGGFPEASVTEDFVLSVRLHERGWRSIYLPEVVASGLGPEDIASYVSQQQRWARGCLGAIPAILRARLPWRQRLQYLLSATYFLSGWTLIVYMSLPVVRILFGIQPLAATSADQFLLHFAPYYCAALAMVATAGYGTYTFGAFALAAGSFWIHVQATINALLRRRARFVVTPKQGREVRQPRAVAPTLATLGILLGAGAYGLITDRSAATLNNVAFAALHAIVLLSAVTPALRVRHSAPLPPSPAPAPAVPRERRYPRGLLPAALGALALILVAAGAFAAHVLRERPPLPAQAHVTAEHFLARYVGGDGRVIRRDQGGDTVSEGQAYAMLLAVALDNRARFEAVWGWTRSHLQRPDGLLAYRWADGRVVSDQAATDADLDAARALVLAGKGFGSVADRRAGERIARAVLNQETGSSGGLPILVAGPWARASGIVNPSYFSPRAYADLANVSHDPRRSALAATSRTLALGLTKNGALPPDWALAGGAGTRALGDPSRPTAADVTPVSGLDAERLAIRAAESCVPADHRLAAVLWRGYRRDPGRATYALEGSPRSTDSHATSFMAAAAAARAAGDLEASRALLDRAQAADSAHPTYYGAAWLALGRVMLTSTALGGCRSSIGGTGA